MTSQRIAWCISLVLMLQCGVEARLGWFRLPSSVKPSTHSSSFERVNNNLLVRGGEKSGSSDEKIKGCCIGIDLGTTFRFVFVPFYFRVH